MEQTNTTEQNINTEDYIVRGTAAGGQIRVFAATTRKLVEEARQRHNTSPVVTAALGRLLTAGAVMGSMMKGERDSVTLIIKGDGPVGKLTVTADTKGHVKGYADEPVVLIHAKPNGKLDVSGAIGKGTLKVIKDIGMKEPYAGEIDLVTGEIAEDLTYYFASSEQTPSAVGLGVLMNRDNTVNCAGGFFVQLLPDCSEEVISELELRLAAVTSVTDLLSDGYTPEDILTALFRDMDLELLEKTPAEFYCGCQEGEMSRAKQAVLSLEKKEIEEMIREEKPVTVHCHFCNTDTVLSVEELQELLEKKEATEE